MTKSANSMFMNRSITIGQTKRSLHNASWRDSRKRWALATILIPTIGFLVAVLQILFFDVEVVEIGLLISMYVLTMIGVEVGFHRHFSHRSFQSNRVIRIALAILGSMAAQGPPIYWVSSHRCHHQYSDRSGDMHSPYVSGDNPLQQLQGMWHAHLGWMLKNNIPNSILYAKDLLRDPIITKVNQLYLVWVILGLIIPAILGGLLMWTWQGILQGFLWGGLVRIFLVHHAVWSVNSLAHLYGSRPFKTDDSSTNNVWLVIPSLGGAWHNNHHAFPTSAVNNLRWWQIDLGGYIIWILEKLGWAWNVNRPSEKMLQIKKR
jgi:stearoyl-CoA desaturase (Delta-9 desaturase)